MRLTSVAALIVLGLTLSGCAERDGRARWYKGNTHTHSLWSDGNDFPDMIVAWYRERDYDFLALSDHNVLSRGERWMAVDAIVKRAGGDDVMTKYLDRFGGEWVAMREAKNKDGVTVKQVRLKTLDEIRPRFEKPGEFLLIEAEEITDGFQRKPVHINAVNLPELIKPQQGKSVRDTMRNNLRAVLALQKKTGKPILAHLNHPNFRWGVTAEDLAHVLEEDFFEVYNGHPGVRHVGNADHAAVERMWDIANTIRLGQLNARPLFAVATDDSHHYHGRRNSSPGRGWIMVRTRNLSGDAIVKAMRRGDFYASSGVTLSEVRYSPSEKLLEIEIEPDGDAEFTTRFIGTETEYDRESEPVTDAGGKPLDVTRRYSSDVGKVLATVKGTTAVYRLTGRELYVRATVTSSKPADNPAFTGQFKQAWTQPVGWKKHVAADRSQRR
ncbi:MAG: hypothetical protein IID33_07805 [Planctomycetes bacterium]|nr:hypothetical protein [Planctomycetota bacterium]